MDLKGLGCENKLNICNSTQKPNFFLMKINFWFKRKCEISWDSVSCSRSTVPWN